MGREWPCIRLSRHRTGVKELRIYWKKRLHGTYEWNPSEVPEDDQEAPLLMVHIPCLGNAFLALAASAT